MGVLALVPLCTCACMGATHAYTRDRLFLKEASTLAHMMQFTTKLKHPEQVWIGCDAIRFIISQLTASFKDGRKRKGTDRPAMIKRVHSGLMPTKYFCFEPIPLNNLLCRGEAKTLLGSTKSACPKLETGGKELSSRASRARCMGFCSSVLHN